MGMNTPGSNHPPNKRTMKAIKRRDDLVARYVAEGMSKEAATERAQKEMRNNEKGDWRRG
jgi:hypothetical protein